MRYYNDNYFCNKSVVEVAATLEGLRAIPTGDDNACIRSAADYETSLAYDAQRSELIMLAERVLANAGAHERERLFRVRMKEWYAPKKKVGNL